MANPDPEITYPRRARPRARRHHGDRPQRLSEPGQQRARLPLHLPRRAGRARHAINEEMKLAAAKALADLAKEDVPDSVHPGLRGERDCASAASTSSPSRSTARAAVGRRPRSPRPRCTRVCPPDRSTGTSTARARADVFGPRQDMPGLSQGEAGAAGGSSSPRERNRSILRAAQILVDEGTCRTRAARSATRRRSCAEARRAGLS